MKTLLVDLGNSRIKWAWQYNGQWSGYGAQFHHGEPLENGLSVLFQQQPGRVLINSVMGESLQQRIQTLAQQTGLNLHWACSSAQFGGLKNGYQQPEQLGSDRWLGMIAAQHAYSERPLCVVSCGTAVTIDAISPQGQHLGGMILPGLRMMGQSLHQGTRQVKVETTSLPVQMLGSNTAEAVNAGCHYAIVGAITQMAAKVSVEYNEIVKCIVTGGDAAQISPLLEAVDVEQRPQLVLEGLALWGHNK